MITYLVKDLDTGLTYEYEDLEDMINDLRSFVCFDHNHYEVFKLGGDN